MATRLGPLGHGPSGFADDLDEAFGHEAGVFIVAPGSDQDLEALRERGPPSYGTSGTRWHG